MPATILIAAYIALVTIPVGLGWVLVGPARPWLDELSSALALAGFAALLLEFLLSGRFRAVSGDIGIDRTMRWHQVFARVLTVALLLHPVLYSYNAYQFAGPGLWQTLPPGDPARAAVLGLAPASTLTGWMASMFLLALTGMAIFRDGLPYGYETWRLMHGLTAAAVATMGMQHALEAGRYSAAPVLAAYWAILVGLALFTLLTVYLLRPLRLARRPWRVVSVAPAAEHIWEVVLEPEGHDGLAYRAGQFAWVRLDRSAFSLREHPFSIASAPGADRRLSLLIKEAGDFTRTVGTLPVGARAFVDGPHGQLTIAGRDEPGLCLFAGGVGVAPLLSVLRGARAAGDARPALLLYGNRHERQILARGELAAMDAVETVHVLQEPPAGWDGATGLVSAALVQERCAAAAGAGWLFLLCGPPAMMREVLRGLRALGVPRARILEERFVYD